MHMKPVEKNIIDLSNWLEQPAGRYILDWERALFDELTVDIFGFNALQIGLPCVDALAASRMPYRWCSDEVATRQCQINMTSKIVVAHDFTELPFDSHSLDLVVLPHALEFASEPHQILREVERVLIPEGRLIVSGFNRNSLWGARQLAGRIRGNYFLPQEGEFISFPRLKDWLKLLNMEVERSDFGCYVPPFFTEKWLNRYQFMEKAGQRWWPFLGAVYMVQAVKRVKGMHLIGPVKRSRQVARASVMPVTNKAKKNDG